MRLGQDLLQTNRIIKILSVMINSADSVDQHELAFHEMSKPVVQALVLGEPAVTAQIEFIALMFESCSEAANVIVPLEQGNANSVRT